MHSQDLHKHQTSKMESLTTIIAAITPNLLSTETVFQRRSIKRCLRPATLFKKDILAQVFSYEFCEIFKNTLFTEHFWTTASEFTR